jgi:hypothetical protein
VSAFIVGIVFNDFAGLYCVADFLPSNHPFRSEHLVQCMGEEKDFPVRRSPYLKQDVQTGIHGDILHDQSSTFNNPTSRCRPVA